MSRWYNQLVNGTMAAASSGLSPAVFAALEQRRSHALSSRRILQQMGLYEPPMAFVTNSPAPAPTVPKWEDMSAAQKRDLHNTNPEAFEASMVDYDRRIARRAETGR